MTYPISAIKHPYWSEKSQDWAKWRAVYDGGDRYVDRYLKQFSKRETPADFQNRKQLSPTPNFAKAAINDVKNSIFQRLVDVNRREGSKSYQAATRGENFGVDLHGASMNGYIGRELLAELLVMSRVGVFVDMPRLKGNTLRDSLGVQPYLYKYRTEDILSWRYRPGSPDEFDQVLLVDHVETYHDSFGLPMSTKQRYRYMFLGDDGLCHVRFYEKSPDQQITEPVQVGLDGSPSGDDLILQIKVIPFVLFQLSDSLLADVANHQIALLNLESSDINYSLKSNFPFYVEQSDERGGSLHLSGPGGPDSDGTSADANTAKGKEITVGANHGRRYSQGMEAPSFIHPSPEPLQASMAKQAALKNDIRSLINLSLSNIQSSRESGVARSYDERGLEGGLSNIGLELEHCERKIARYWHMLEGSSAVASVKYPEKWSLRSDEDRRKDAASLRELRDTIPSERFQKSVSQEIARLLLADKVSNADLDKILAEIDKAESYTADPETIFRAVELGIMDLTFAAELLGWPESVVKKAAEDHAARLARIAAHQMKGVNPAARGLGDLDGEPGQSGKDEKAESKDQTENDDPSEAVRGKTKEEATL